MNLATRLPAIGIALALSLTVLGTSAKAAFVTTQELGMDAIFSQSSFGTSTIDIRFGAVQTVFAPTLLDITSNEEIDQVFNLFGGSPTVNFYYVDTVNSCGGFNVSIVGCGAVGGNDFVVESSFAAGGFGAELLAHELVHNLGLGHRNGATALMDPFLNGGTILDAAEVAQILLNGPGLIQSDIEGLFIDVNPVLIVAELISVPLTASVFMLIGGLVLLGGIGRRGARFKSKTVSA